MKAVVTDLTQNQMLLWLGQQLAPESPLYNMVHTFELRGQINPKYFRAAFQILVNRSDALRTVFEVKDGKPVQKIYESFLYETEYLDWSTLPNSEEYYKEWSQERVQKKFNLSECLFDNVLIKFSEKRYLWYLNQHHLITDSWSFSVIQKQMAQFYQLAKNRNSDNAPHLPPFKNYIEFENKIRTAPEKENARQYWNDKLKNLPSKPSFYGRKTAELTTRSDRTAINLGIERSEKLRALAMESGIRSWTQSLSLFNIFATALFAFLYRITGQQKLTVGTPSHNRPTKAFKETVGVFIETLPVVAEIEKGDSFFSLLKKIQTEVNGFLKYAQPGMSTPELSRSFNVFYNYIHAGFSDFNEIPMTSDWIHPNHCDTLHHLRFQVHDFDRSGEIQLYFDLNCNAFDKEKYTLVPQHFLAILDGFIEDKNREIGSIPILTEPEFRELIFDFNENESETTENENIIQLIEKQVEKTPDLTSVVFKNQPLSYRDLNQKANQLAHWLKSKNIGEGHRVAICLKRSPEYVISVLAILKTGAAFIPIPGTHPKERILYVLEDSQASLLISDGVLNSRFESDNIPVFNFNQSESVLKSYPTENLPLSGSLDSASFLIYTSGSTGNPKGVVITNRAIAGYIKWTKAAYINRTNPAIPLFTTIGFDITANSVFLPLICGGTVHVYREGDSDIDLSILEVIEEDKVDFIKVTPAHLAFLKGKKIEKTKLDVMVVTGDEFKTDLGLAIYKTFDGKVKIYNEYGPSEATIGCIYHQFTPDITDPSVPIGKPIHNMEAYILNEFQNPVPRGVIGELYLGGIGLADGYWNKPELTEEKFLPNPFKHNAKMYKTGDLARINENDIIEFFGRIDFQVKINGHRIELGEIEAQIVKYASVKGCVVTVIEDEFELRHLAAYFTADSLVLLPKLKAHLVEKLPAYMVPTHFRRLETFPLSPNGKIDRKALKRLETVIVGHEIEFVPPQTEIEEVVAEVWQTVLNIPKIGIHDRFIDLGGNSLLAIQLATRIFDALELEVPLNKIFELPTIKKQSDYLESEMLRILDGVD